jgi:hypothetical protein
MRIFQLRRQIRLLQSGIKGVDAAGTHVFILD